MVLSRLIQYRCQLRLDKFDKRTKFGATSLSYLGHIVSGKGIETKPALVRAVQDFPSPALAPSPQIAKTKVRSFVALANFYRRFIKHFSQIALPLLTLTHKKSTFSWQAPQENAFRVLKSAISSAPVLAYPQWDREFVLTTDASEIGVGAVLEQMDENSQLRPLHFLSHAFTEQEKRWSMPEKEIYALVFAVQKLRVYLYAQPFRWRTDASGLTWLHSAKHLSPKLMRWVLLLSEYKFSIEHISTKENLVTNALSRSPLVSSIQQLSHDLNISSVTPPIFTSLPALPFDRLKLITEQRIDSFCRSWISALNPSLVLPQLTAKEAKVEACRTYYSTRKRLLSRFILLDNLLFFISDIPSYRRSLQHDRRNFIRIVAPFTLRTSIFSYFHYKSHQQKLRTIRDVSAHFYWPNLTPDITQYIASCHPCNSRNARLYLHGVLRSTSATSATHRMSIDLIGPRPITPEGYRWIMVIVNHFTKWITAVPLKDRTTNTLVRAVDDFWLSEGYACSEVYADRAPELWTTEFKSLLARYGSKFVPGPPHHSESQGHVERANRTVQDGIAKRLEGSEHQWSQFLKPIIYAYRLTVHTATGHTPFFLTHGWEPLTPLVSSILPVMPTTESLSYYVSKLRSSIQEAWDSAATRLATYHAKTASKINKNRRPFSLPLDSFEYVRLPPSKRQSQGLQSFNSGLWKLLRFDSTSNKCTVKTRVGNTERTQDVHAQYVFPFEGTLSFSPTKDYPENWNEDIQQTPDLRLHPHINRPKRKGRPSAKPNRPLSTR